MTLYEQLSTAARMEREGFSKKETDDYLREVQLKHDEDKATKKQMEWLPADSLPKKGKGILFLDEMNSAPQSVQAALRAVNTSTKTLNMSPSSDAKTAATAVFLQKIATAATARLLAAP